MGASAEVLYEENESGGVDELVITTKRTPLPACSYKKKRFPFKHEYKTVQEATISCSEHSHTELRQKCPCGKKRVKKTDFKKLT